MAEKKKSLTLNQETIDVLVANVIPTTRYFEARFDLMQVQTDEMKKNIRDLEERMNQRFEQVDRRFEQVDKKFEQIDADIRGVREGMATLTDKVSELTVEVKTSVRDYIIERDRYYDRKFNNLRVFVIALLVGVGGLFLKAIGFFDKVFK
jgi:CRISPR/Cas system-associated exonuclease Cas4 (RecB family)